MIARLLIAATLALAPVCSSAAPAFLALPSRDTLTIKLLNTEQSPPFSYAISHWPDGAPLGSGEITQASVSTDAEGRRTFTIQGLNPRLWWPGDPQLYTVSITSAGEPLGTARIGFRTFEMQGGRFLLNGRPIYLRGVPINPPGRGEPPEVNHDRKYIDGYLRLLKSHHVNLIRTEGDDWLDACDELGMMVFQGNYGSAPGGRKSDPGIRTGGDIPPSLASAIPAYRRIFANLANHPSVVIYVLTNEVDNPRSYPKGQYLPFLEKVQSDVQSFDPTRPIIANAGFGNGLPKGGVYDLHRYAGWYSGTMVDWYDLSPWLQDARRMDEPFTISECVGAYTSDAGDFLTMSKQLSTMIRWVGTEPDPRQAAMAYQAELVRQVVEITRRKRTRSDPGVASTMPFTYFLGISRATTPEAIIQKPAFQELGVAFQPILISPECWTRNLSPGDALRMRLHIINDDDNGQALTGASAEVVIKDSRGGRVFEPVSLPLDPVPYYSNLIKDCSVAIPADISPGQYEVACALKANQQTVSTNAFTIHVRAPAPPQSGSPAVFDPKGRTIAALRALGLSPQTVQSLDTLPESGVLIIGEEALANALPDAKDIAQFLDKGGHILCLRQTPESWNSRWLPFDLQIGPQRAFTYIQRMGQNPALWKDLTNADLRIWNQDGVAPGGVPNVFPVYSTLTAPRLQDLRSVRAWAATDRMLTGAALMEVFRGRGSILLSQFACVDRVPSDPVAARLLANLVNYTLGTDHPGLLDLSQPIHWDLRAFSEGALASNLQGFLPYSPTYSHTGASKGRLGDDHRIVGATLVGHYGFTSNGWLRPVPDPKAEGWGVLFGRLSRPARAFVLSAHNSSHQPESVRLLLDGTLVGADATIAPGQSKTIRWSVARDAGPVRVELRGGQKIVISQTQFE